MIVKFCHTISTLSCHHLHPLKKSAVCSLSSNITARPVIGLEFHAQIASSYKLFSPMKTDYFGRLPNTLVSPFDLAVPGTMPVIQFEPVVLALATAIALNCTIPKESKFDRKHYTYPDLPHGYQITQKFLPLALDGYLHLGKWDGVSPSKNIRIQQLHLEQDTGKLFHSDEHTLIDYNRAGIPLMEIVTHPDITSSKEAAIAVKTLQALLQSIFTCNANLEDGSLRVDVNVSMTATDPITHLNISTERVEIKNISTISGLYNALEFEIQRQTLLLRQGMRGNRETRGYNASTKSTYLQRSKESTNDYRYIHDTEIPAISISLEEVHKVRKAVESYLPNTVRERLAQQFPGLSVAQINWLVSTSPRKETLDSGHQVRHSYFSSINQEYTEPTRVFNARLHTAADFLLAMHDACANDPTDVVLMYHWLANDVMGQITSFQNEGKPLQAHDNWGISPTQLHSIVNCVLNNSITGKVGKCILDLILQADGLETRLAEQIATEKGWIMDTSTNNVQEWIFEAMRTTPRKPGVSDKTYVTWLTGQIMKLSRGKANPLTVRNAIINLTGDQVKKS